MKTLAIILLFPALAMATDYNERQSLNRARIGLPALGAAEEVSATAASSDASTSLNVNQMYVIICDSQVYMRFCANTTCTAASGDMKWPADMPFYFVTGASSGGPLVVAARNVAVNGSCWLLGLN
jgi:hypothetical protein